MESPLAQPRNSVLGHFFAAVVGVCVTKIFGFSHNFEDLRWIAGAVSCSVACAVMELTKTTHPPAGATALLAAVDPNISRLGWFLLPVVLVSSLLMLVSALLINNVQRQFPMYWWTPTDLSQPQASNEMDVEDLMGNHIFRGTRSYGNEMDDRLEIVVAREHILIPRWIYLADEEIGVLEILRKRLKEGVENRGRASSAYHRRHSHP